MARRADLARRIFSNMLQRSGWLQRLALGSQLLLGAKCQASFVGGFACLLTRYFLSTCLRFPYARSTDLTGSLFPSARNFSQRSACPLAASL